LVAATHSDRLDIVNDIFIVTLLFDSTRVITKLPNSEQSYKRKVLENCENRNDPDLVQAFLKKWWVESDFKAPNMIKI